MALAGFLVGVVGVAAVSLFESDWSEGEQRIAEVFPGLVSEGSGGKGWLGARCTTGVREMGQRGKIACTSNSVNFSIADYGNPEERSGSVDWPEESSFIHARCFTQGDVTPVSAQADGAPPRYAVLPVAPNDSFAVLVAGDNVDQLLAEIPVCPSSNLADGTPLQKNLSPAEAGAKPQ